MAGFGQTKTTPNMIKFMQSIFCALHFLLRSDIIKKLYSIIISLSLVAIIVIFPQTKAKASASVSGAGRVNTRSTSLNVRSGSGTGYSRVATVQKDSYVTLISLNNGWWYVKYADGKYGYCNSDYIFVLSENVKTVKTTYGNLSVRSGPSTSYSIVSKLPSGNKVAILSESNGWAKILYDGSSIGYVSSTYLVSSNNTSSQKYTSVKLSVPSYKQTDSRWSGVKLGNSSATIGKQGCLVTSFAMTESYRTNSTITPSSMAKKSSFTSSGAMYWPNGYTAYYNSSYLNKIYELLKSGTPVLIGGRSSSGATHWVVVTGFTGGDTLTTSSFLINDPGSNTNTTLAQFKAKYINHIRLMYYAG